MTDKRYKPHCKHVDTCDHPCGFEYSIMACFELEPTMMICPDAETCDHPCWHAKQHKKVERGRLRRTEACNFVNTGCPPCVPIEQPKPEPPAPQPVDLGVIEARTRADFATLGQRMADFLALIAEVKRLRRERDDARNLATEMQNLSFDLGMEKASLERGVDMICKMNNTKADTIERLRQERDEAREGESHWQRAFDRSVSMRTVLETERNKARRELEAIERQRDRLLSLGKSDNDVICRLRLEYAELETERDELRDELEAMTRANEQPGGLVREAQAGTVMVGGEE